MLECPPGGGGWEEPSRYFACWPDASALQPSPLTRGITASMQRQGPGRPSPDRVRLPPLRRLQRGVGQPAPRRHSSPAIHPPLVLPRRQGGVPPARSCMPPIAGMATVMLRGGVCVRRRRRLVRAVPPPFRHTAGAPHSPSPNHAARGRASLWLWVPPRDGRHARLYAHVIKGSAVKLRGRIQVLNLPELCRAGGQDYLVNPPHVLPLLIGHGVESRAIL